MTLKNILTMLILSSSLCGCGGTHVDCKNVGSKEEELMIVGYYHSQMSFSVEKNMKCMKKYLSVPNSRDDKCWRQLATTSGTQSVSGGVGEDFESVDELFLVEFRSVTGDYNQVLDEIETYYTSIIEKGNYEYFHEADSVQVDDLIFKLERVNNSVNELSKKLHRLTGLKPSGEWGYCNSSDKGRAETYVLKNTRTPFYAWEPLRGE